MSAGSATAIVTDTTSYLPDELIARHGIHRISLYVAIDGDQRSEADISASEYDDFYERLRRSAEGATTSQPSVGDFLSVYEPLLADGREVVSIHISAGISGTVESARQARRQLIDSGKGGERITVWDSRSGCGGQGLMALTAARAAAAGANAEQTLDRVERARDRLQMWFAIDTLEYLRRGGRIGAASAWIGSTLRVKPILTLEGEMKPVERVRTSSRMLDRLVEYARQRHDSGADGWAAQHINAPEQCGVLVDRCSEIFGRPPIMVSEIGPVLSAHTGPGLLGVGSIPERFLA